MIELYSKKQNCCGCTACLSICGQKAITMAADEEGFLYPKINTKLCNECGLCTKVCSFKENYDKSCNLETPVVYAVKHKSNEVRMSSTSGGMFTAISDYILSKNGYVFGVSFDDDFNVVHKKAANKKECDEFKGSKYVQSNLKDIFKQIKLELEKKEIVLFTGTPCQTAGLKSYLNKEYVNLYLVDLVCHGTSSPLIWKEYVHFCENINKSKFKEFYFRAKDKGWEAHTEKAVYANGKIDFTSLLSKVNKTLYYSHMTLRPSCSECKFCNLKRPSDITIADFWGIAKTMPEFKDEKGVSLVLVNTSKGQSLFSEISMTLEYRLSNTRDCLQHNLQQPTAASPLRDQFWNNYQKHGFKYIAGKYGNCRNAVKLRLFTRRIIIIMLKRLGLYSRLKKVLNR